MILFPSTPLLIHILAVLCLSYRLVLSEDADLFDEVVANDEAGEGSVTNSTDSTTMESSTTEYSTTESDLNTTESISWTSSTAGNLPCVPSTKKDAPSMCVLEGTEDQCDPCEGRDCGVDKKCVVDYSTCKASDTHCDCTDPLTYNKDGVCTNPCGPPSPCKNDRPCQSKPTEKLKYHCECGSDYDGDDCGTVHDYCKDEHPADCPLGARDCKLLGVGKYSCGCVDGYILDNSTFTCIKVTQRLSVNLKFNTLYKEAYNIEGNPDRVMAINSIDAAMADLYGDLLIPPVSYSNFTEGSLIAHYNMNMRMGKNGDPEKNVNDLMIYVTNCATNNAPTKKCFDAELGKPFLLENGAVSEDLRCDDVYCPVGTHCEPIQKSENIRCSCDEGFTLNRTVVEDTGRQIDICDDINECELDPSPCKGTELCNNTPGSFECLGSPCDKNPCPGNAECKAVDQYAYECHCSWIYVASDCGTPWMLILVIVSSVLLALLILAIIGLIILFSRSKSGSSVLEATSF
ncbi:hypothetical protein PMAYCL1PPCAC_12756 [Pristionchus mayeri]|uniref:EGF-like domain-containing protein n=1 Tax=Pristionchus mayeri TaxID=1317129 RepID=A0AAN5CH28_9BILA|nr:hypothetical protein PMAYCL1PPCAC_12756 [Pristionchus mayeri]